MHLLVPFASVLSDAGRAAQQGLALPNLGRLVAGLAETARDLGDELSLSAPHERALAQALGLGGDDGHLPLAALLAQQAGLEADGRAWGLLTPTHWQVGTDQISLLDPGALRLDEADSRTLLEAVRELFESEGFALHYVAPDRWLATHPVLAGLPCASLDRVIGRNVDLWLPADPRTRLVRRLQNEVQMLLYRHPLNEAREARGEWAVNSFWLSGCGVAPALAFPDDLVLDDRLRAPALAEDWFAWSRAFGQIDDGPIAQALALQRRGGAVRLTLCGERGAISWGPTTRGWWRRSLAGLRPAEPTTLLQDL